MAIRLKIISDGTPLGTQVVNEATGERLEQIQAVEWRISVHSLAEATLVFRNIPVEVSGVAIGGRGIKREKIHKRRIEMEDVEHEKDNWLGSDN